MEYIAAMYIFIDECDIYHKRAKIECQLLFYRFSNL